MAANGVSAGAGARPSALTWECHLDAQSGRYFFHNEVTHETTWRQPQDWDILWFIDPQHRTRYFQDRVNYGWMAKSKPL